MLFSSYVFVFCFLPVVLTGFAVLARLSGRAGAAPWLVAASFVFYGWWNPAFVPLLLGSIAFNYALARLIGRAGARPRVQSTLVALGIGCDLAALVYYKYLASILAFLRLHGWSGVTLDSPALPLGISFFTFTQIGFLLDTRNGTVEERGFSSYLLFVTFFPHLIAGPVLHHREMMPQFAAPETYRLSGENILVGLTIFAIGLAKKVLADQLSGVAAPGFSSADRLALLPAWQAALGYSMQLYFDFSGYSDMAIGTARLFNIRFPANFNSPYKARSVIEYWQRWHMTLTRYLSLYLYNPIALHIARSRAARGVPPGRQRSVRGFAATVLVPTAITMTLAGVWHGSGLTFLVFGLLHAAYLSVNHAWRTFRPAAWKPSRSRAGACRSVALTYGCVLVGAVVFRAETLADAGAVLSGMLGLHGVVPPASAQERVLTVVRDWTLIALAAAIAFGAPNTQQIMRDFAPVLSPVAGRGWAWRPNLGWALAFGCLGALGLLGIGGSAEFLYFQF